MNKIDFVAIDFEHAVAFRGSVCSVGIITYKNGNIIEEYTTLIQPPNNEYNRRTIEVHGITPEKTKNSPIFSDVYPEIRRRIDGKTVVAHNAFNTDKICLEQAMEYYGIHEQLNISWRCTYQITNAKLNIVAQVCKIELNHHDALSDAKVCAQIFYLWKNGQLPTDEIEIAKAKAVDNKKPKKNFFHGERLKGKIFQPDFEHAINKTNPFFMKKVVVTGFASAIKKEVAFELKKLGADIDSGVSKRTNYLITGENAGPSKLAKMKKNIEEGKEAHIIDLDSYNKLKTTHI